MKGRVVIVDPYSAAAMLAPQIAKLGYECVALQSAPEIPPLFRAQAIRGFRVLKLKFAISTR